MLNLEVTDEAHDPKRQLYEIELEMIKTHGWLIHYVNDDSGSPTRYNIHTHGMAENLKHTDLQTVAIVPPSVIVPILHCIVDQIKGGKTFKDGDVVPGIIQNFNVKFVAATEGGRPVLRIVMPDKKGNVEKDMDEPYSLQYKDLPVDIYKDEVVFTDP